MNSSAAARVLVVDDDPTLRKLVVRTLQKYGYVAQEVSSAEEALALLASADMHFDLLLSDVVMPKMSGLELVARARTLYPQMALLVMSGNIERVADDPGEHVAFLSKPFTPDILAEHVRKALADRS